MIEEGIGKQDKSLAKDLVFDHDPPEDKDLIVVDKDRLKGGQLHLKSFLVVGRDQSLYGGRRPRQAFPFQR